MSQNDTDNGRGSNGDDGHPDVRPLPWVALADGIAPSADEYACEENAPVAVEEANGRTGFDATDVDDNQGWWQHLRELDNGKGHPKRDMQLRAAGIQRDLDMVCTRLDCTDYQRERAAWLIDQLDLKADVIRDGPVELAVVGIVSLVVDEDRTRFGRMGRSVQSVMRDDAFTSLVSDFDLSMSRIRTVRKRVRDTDEYDSPNG